MKKLIVILSIFTAMFMLACNSSNEDTVQVTPLQDCKPDTVIVHDTVQVLPTLTKKKHVNNNKTKVTKKVLSSTVDTLAIIEKYKASLKPVEIAVHDTVLIVVKTNSFVERKVLELKEVPAPAKRNFYAGFGTTINRNVFGSIYLGGLYKTKKNEILKLDVGIENNGSGRFYPFVGTGIYFPIK